MQKILLFVPICVGLLMPFQGALNARLGQFLSHPLQGAAMNFIVGGIILVLANALFGAPWPGIKPMSEIPPYYYLGGAVGAVFVFSAVYLIPRIGVGPTILGFMVGQLFVSLALDHFGAFGVDVSPINLPKVIGATFLLTGLILVMQNK